MRQQHEFRRRAAENNQRQQVVGEIFRAGARALDDFEQQQQDAERQQHRSGSPPIRRLTSTIVNSGAENDRIRKTMMLQIASGIAQRETDHAHR